MIVYSIKSGRKPILLLTLTVLLNNSKMYHFFLFAPPPKVLNQTSRLEIQLLENSLSTYKLEKQLLQQTHEILKIHEKNR